MYVKEWLSWDAFLLYYPSHSRSRSFQTFQVKQLLDQFLKSRQSLFFHYILLNMTGSDDNGMRLDHLLFVKMEEKFRCIII